MPKTLLKIKVVKDNFLEYFANNLETSIVILRFLEQLRFSCTLDFSCILDISCTLDFIVTGHVSIH